LPPALIQLQIIITETCDPKAWLVCIAGRVYIYHIVHNYERLPRHTLFSQDVVGEQWIPDPPFTRRIEVQDSPLSSHSIACLPVRGCRWRFWSEGRREDVSQPLLNHTSLQLSPLPHLPHLDPCLCTWKGNFQVVIAGCLVYKAGEVPTLL